MQWSGYKLTELHYRVINLIFYNLRNHLYFLLCRLVTAKNTLRTGRLSLIKYVFTYQLRKELLISMRLRGMGDLFEKKGKTKQKNILRE